MSILPHTIKERLGNVAAKTGAVKRWKTDPGDLAGAREAAAYYAAKHNCDFVIVPHSQFGRLVFQVEPVADWAKFKTWESYGMVFTPGREILAEKVEPSGALFQIVAKPSKKGKKSPGKPAYSPKIAQIKATKKKKPAESDPTTEPVTCGRGFVVVRRHCRRLPDKPSKKKQTKKKAAKPATKRRRKPEGVKTGPAVVGKETQYSHPPGTAGPGIRNAYTVRYEVRPLGSLIPSHNPTSGFEPRPDFPQSLQERDYSRDTQEQDKVKAIASDLKPDWLLSLATGAGEGPPIITPAGIVLSGNGRTQGLLLAAQWHPNSFKKYTAALRRRAASDFGITAAIPAGAALVRVVDIDLSTPAGLEEARLFGLRANDRVGLERTELGRAAAIAENLPIEIVYRLDESLADSTLGDVLTGSAGAGLRKWLLEESELSQADQRTLFDPKQEHLTDTGKIFLRRVLSILALTAPEIVQMVEDDPALNRTLESALPALLKARRSVLSNKITPAHDLHRRIITALTFWHENLFGRGYTVKRWRDWKRQRALPGFEKPDAGPEIEATFDFLATNYGKPKQLRQAILRFVSLAESEKSLTKGIFAAEAGEPMSFTDLLDAAGKTSANVAGLSALAGATGTASRRQRTKTVSFPERNGADVFSPAWIEKTEGDIKTIARALKSSIWPQGARRPRGIEVVPGNKSRAWLIAPLSTGAKGFRVGNWDELGPSGHFDYKSADYGKNEAPEDRKSIWYKIAQGELYGAAPGRLVKGKMRDKDKIYYRILSAGRSLVDWWIKQPLGKWGLETVQVRAEGNRLRLRGDYEAAAKYEKENWPRGPRPDSSPIPESIGCGPMAKTKTPPTPADLSELGARRQPRKKIPRTATVSAKDVESALADETIYISHLVDLSLGDMRKWFDDSAEKIKKLYRKGFTSFVKRMLAAVIVAARFAAKLHKKTPEFKDFAKGDLRKLGLPKVKGFKAGLKYGYGAGPAAGNETTITGAKGNGTVTITTEPVTAVVRRSKKKFKTAAAAKADAATSTGYPASALRAGKHTPALWVFDILTAKVGDLAGVKSIAKGAATGAAAGAIGFTVGQVIGTFLLKHLEKKARAKLDVILKEPVKLQESELRRARLERDITANALRSGKLNHAAVIADIKSLAKRIKDQIEHSRKYARHDRNFKDISDYVGSRLHMDFPEFLGKIAGIMDIGPKTLLVKELSKGDFRRVGLPKFKFNEDVSEFLDGREEIGDLGTTAAYAVAKAKEETKFRRRRRDPDDGDNTRRRGRPGRGGPRRGRGRPKVVGFVIKIRKYRLPPRLALKAAELIKAEMSRDRWLKRQAKGDEIARGAVAAADRADKAYAAGEKDKAREQVAGMIGALGALAATEPKHVMAKAVSAGIPETVGLPKIEVTRRKG